MEFDVDEVVRALDDLDRELGGSAVTSVRVPQALRRAASVLQDAGLISSWSDLLVQGARDRVEAITRRAGLDAHYAEHPEMRPSLTEVATAMAEMDADPLASEPALIEQAAAELAAQRPDATPDEVLVYAMALRAHRPAA